MTDVILAKFETEGDIAKIAPPFGILYLADALEKNGLSVKLIHEEGNKVNIEALTELVLKETPSLVGFSSITGPSLLPTLNASKKIKEKSKIPIVWGGLHPTMLPEQTLNNENIDIVVLGEGEITIVELAKALALNGYEPNMLKKIQGIGYKDNGKIKINPARPFITNLDDYFPAWHYLDVERYLYKGSFFYSKIGSKLAGNKIAAIMTSRGCPWRCGYCYNQFVNKRTFRSHSALKVIKYIDNLKEHYNISAIVFEDDHLFTDKNRALEIIRNIDMPWSASIRANYVAQWGEEFVEKLSDYDCFELRIGAESGSQRILDIMQKDIKLEEIYNSAKLCLKYNIKVLMGFMCGIPGETWTDMLKTFQFIDDLEEMGVTVAAGPALFIPYPGTPLYDLAIEKGFIPPQRIEDWGVNWGPRQPPIPSVDRRAKFAGYYRTLAVRKDTDAFKYPFFVEILKWIAKKRWKKRFFWLPFDYYIPRLFFKLLQALGLKKITRAVYN